MGVSCIVFDIVGMLFEFLKYSHFMFSSRFMLFPTFLEKKIHGGQKKLQFFSHFILRFMLFSTKKFFGGGKYNTMQYKILYCFRINIGLRKNQIQ